MSADDIDEWPVTDRDDRYPSELVCDVRTSTGYLVHLRPIRSDDGGRLRQFHDHLSAHSVYLRYFFTHPRLTEAEIDRFTHVDYVHRLALVGEDRDRIIAVGRYEQLPGTSEAEAAFIVADEAQHQGIGSLLLARLADAAVANGMTAFVAETLAENRAMIDVFLNSGFPVTTHAEYGTVDIRFPIGGTSAHDKTNGKVVVIENCGVGKLPYPVCSRSLRPEEVGQMAGSTSITESPCLWA